VRYLLNITLRKKTLPINSYLQNHPNYVPITVSLINLQHTFWDILPYISKFVDSNQYFLFSHKSLEQPNDIALYIHEMRVIAYVTL
jgi:hypothetical protein